MKTLQPTRRCCSVKPVAKKASPIFPKNNARPSIPAETSPLKNSFSIFEENLLDVSHRNLADFSFLNEPVRNLNASFNAFKDFSGFPSNFRTQEIDVSDCPITSFRGAQEVSHLQNIKMYHCPISENENFRVSAIIAFGQSVKIINGEQIKAAERQVAHTNSNLSEIVRLGWVPNGEFPKNLEEINRIKNELLESNVQIAKSPVKPMLRRRGNKNSAAREVQASQCAERDIAITPPTGKAGAEFLNS